MKKTLLFLALTHFVTFLALSAPGDTTRLRVHDAVDMVWYENYDRPVVFPNSTTTYSKILMHYTLGCASTGCSDWDYTTKIELLKATGIMDSTVADVDTISVSPLIVDTTWNVFEVKESFELARVITPYGSYMRNGQQGYTPNWKHVHTFDVTDYAPLLRGANDLRAFYAGWSSGFSVTIDFEFIEGTPPREVLEVRNLWQSGGNGWNYQNTTHFEQTYLHPLTVSIPQEMENAKLRFIPSGHGFDNNTGCAEFCERMYYLKLNGSQVDARLMWDEACGLNPIYPQGGTWLYDRANWCPGLRTHQFDYEFGAQLTAGNSHQLDIDIQPIGWSGTQAPIYILETQLFIYGSKTRQNDVAVDVIISPTNDVNYRRYNPVCNAAKIQIKNYGAQNLTSAVIKYSVNGNNWRTFNWTGNLGFEKTAIVDLPMTAISDWVGTTVPSQFIVEVELPNGQLDENNHNNRLISHFENTPTIPLITEFQFRTNSRPEETTWQLMDANGTVLHQNVPSMTANTLYRDTFDLEPGCYLLQLNDSEKNGLSFWANNNGSGSARLRIPGSSFITTLNPDFGTSLNYYFTVGQSLDVLTPIAIDKAELFIYPNPAKGEFNILFEGTDLEDVVVRVTNSMGQIVQQFVQSINAEGSFERKLDMGDSKPGTYIVHVVSNNHTFTKSLILL